MRSSTKKGAYAKTIFSLAVLVFLSTAPIKVQAIQYTLDFSFSHLIANTNNTYLGTPPSNFAGTISYDADSHVSEINHLTAVDLTVAGHAYTINELLYTSTVNTSYTYYGIGAGPNLQHIPPSGNDFWLFWSAPLANMPLDLSNLAFSIPADTTNIWAIWQQYHLIDDDYLRISQTLLQPVPEPSTFLLLGGGLASLAFYARRRRKE